MQQEPYLSDSEPSTPSWMRSEKKPITFWTIAWAVCTGVLLANTIEAISAAITIYLQMRLYVEPAIKKIFQ